MRSSESKSVGVGLGMVMLLCGVVWGQAIAPWFEGTNKAGTNYFLGKVGIGTNEAEEMLRVVGETRLGGGLVVEGALRVPRQGDLGMGEFTNGVSEQGVVWSNLALRGSWISYDGESEGLYVSEDGKVGVGTGEPQYKLEVDGTGAMRDLEVSGGIMLGGVRRDEWPGGVLHWTYAVPKANWGPVLPEAMTLYRITAQTKEGECSALIYRKAWSNGWDNASLVCAIPLSETPLQTNLIESLGAGEQLGVLFMGGATQQCVLTLELR